MQLNRFPSYRKQIKLSPNVYLQKKQMNNLQTRVHKSKFLWPILHVLPFFFCFSSKEIELLIKSCSNEVLKWK